MHAFAFVSTGTPFSQLVLQVCSADQQDSLMWEIFDTRRTLRARFKLGFVTIEVGMVV